MPLYYISIEDNKLGEVETDADSAKLVKMTMYPVAPNPDKLPAKCPGGISTEWLVKHPSQPMILALTSYWNKRPAHLTCFQVSDPTTGAGLKKLSVEASTAGREAAHAVFAPLDTSTEKVTMAVAHHNDGFVSFFQLDRQQFPTSLMDQPVLSLELPEVEPHTTNVLASNTSIRGVSIPSSHHVEYAPNGGKHLWIVDPNQSVIFTYTVDPETGLPTNMSDAQPSSIFTCHTDRPALGWYSKIMARFVFGIKKGCRPRRVAVSPSGEYLYVSYELRNVIQVYAVDKETGKIDPDNRGCLQEVSTIDDALTKEGVIGFTIQASSEMMVFGHSLFVSNRGGVLGAGKSENSIRIFDIRDGGRLACASQHAVMCSGPVRHFCVHTDDNDNEILVAGTSKPGCSLQTFRRKAPKGGDNGEVSDKFELVGEADVGMNIFCVIPALTADAAAT